MSGHSKWATTKRQKAVVDAKRSANFTKLANLITVAARAGGDVNKNFKLRMAVDKARANSLPKDNIDRAIKRGTGELAGQNFEQMIYEGFGPEKTAVIMDIITDNKNRAAADIKHLLTKFGGSLSGPNSVMWMFEQKGVLVIERSLTDELQLELIDAGADEFEITDKQTTIFCPPDNFEKIKEKLEQKNEKLLSAAIEFLPKETIIIKDEKKWDDFVGLLEKCDDISNYYTNANI
jgi:YebC/PmpR family DNA-binding regulatory protein